MIIGCCLLRLRSAGPASKSSERIPFFNKSELVSHPAGEGAKTRLEIGGKRMNGVSTGVHAVAGWEAVLVYTGVLCAASLE